MRIYNVKEILKWDTANFSEVNFNINIAKSLYVKEFGLCIDF